MSSQVAFPEVGGSARLARALPASTVLPEVGDVRPDETPRQLDRTLTSLARERGPLRAVLARLADRLVGSRAWERLGYARLGDYARERLGRSARFVQDLAQVGWRLSAPNPLEHALVSGSLGWTKVRLLVRLPREENEEAWIAHGRRVTASQLSKEVRAVDRSSVEAGALDADEGRGEPLRVRCTPEVRWKWHTAREAAQRVAGHAVGPSEAAELIAAEVLSAIPVDDAADGGSCEETATSWRPSEAAGAATRPGDGASPRPEGQDPGTLVPHIGPPLRTSGSEPAPPLAARPAYPPAIQPLLEDLAHADAFELDRRLRRALEMEQRLEARIGPF